jgi:3-oxoacyl-[acyl-carrier protein] reductase
MNGKVALITGATSGIGKAIALSFAEKGATVVLVGRDRKKGQEALHEVEALSDGAFFQCDVSDKSQVDRTVYDVIARYEKIDFLINNAGVYKTEPFLNVTEKTWDTVYNINVKGVFFFCQRVLSEMVKTKSGVVINLTSIAAKHGGMMPVAAYASSKSAVLTLTKSLAREFAPLGIRVNGIAPGTIVTPMTAAFGSSKVDSIPLGRLGEPEEVASVVRFLCSEEAAYVTGEIIDINGGQLMD